MKLTTQDCLDVGICTRGQMRFCRKHDIDFRRFEREGIEVSKLAEIDDHNLSRAIVRATQREMESE